MGSGIRFMLVVGLVLGAASVATAQPGARSRGSFPGGGRSGLSLLQDVNVKKDLGITDDQVKKLTDFQAKSRDEMRQAFLALRDLTAEQRTAKFQELQKKIAEMTAAAEKEILLPKQIERLKQISMQYRLNRGNLAGALAGEELGKELSITDAQKEALRKAQEEADAEMQSALTRLREEARQKVLRVLTPDQQAKLKSLTGEPIQFRGRGGPGGAGGTATPPRRPAQGD